MIGPVERSEITTILDPALRDAVKGRFFLITGKHSDNCLSTWGTTEEKFNLLREIECYSEDDLRQVLTELKAMKDAERENNSV